MCNIRRKECYDAVTGDTVNARYDGKNAATFRKVDDANLIFDSRGQYLGIRTSKGKFAKGVCATKKGPYEFKSFVDLRTWTNQGCRKAIFAETKDGTFMRMDSITV